jgi:hypothetical protein
LTRRPPQLVRKDDPDEQHELVGNPSGQRESAISVSRAPIDVEATDRTEVNIAPGDTDKVVEIQPSALGALHLLLIKSSSYGAHLTFKANDGAADSAAVVLDSPQLFSAAASPSSAWRRAG